MLMKTFLLYFPIWLTMVCWDSSNELENVRNEDSLARESVVLSHSASDSSIDYDQYTLLEKRIALPRTGEYFAGAVSYRGISFPLHIYWDLEIDGYNLYAFIDGSASSIDSAMHTLTHVATYNSGCTSSRFDFVIKCNYHHSNYTGFWNEKRHVSFHVIFYPTTYSCSFEILEDGEGLWNALDFEL